MGYYSFLCWFVWRFLTALLAHINWFTAVYIKCIYFTYWKSFDLLWFWMHLFLCICFESLRPENYLLVWFTLIRKKCTTSSNKSFRQIYNETYSRKFTKSERELKEIEVEENSEDELENDDDKSLNSEAKPTVSTNLYPALKSDAEEQAMPTLNVSRKPNDKNTRVNFKQKVEAEVLIDYQGGLNVEKKGILSKVRLPKLLKDRFTSNESGNSPKTPESDTENGKWTGKFPKLLPSALRHATPEEEELKTAAAEEKRLKKENDRKKKQQLKEIRERRKAYLREKAAAERRRKLIADVVELLLQFLRMFTTFAMFMGNIHKARLPIYLVGPESDINNPEILLMFTITMGLDMTMFWIVFFMSFCKQCRMCCRLGCCKFLLYFSILSLGIFIMYYPFHLTSDQLDMTWCKFEVGSEMAKFLYNEGQ